LITQEKLKKYLHYSEEDGSFTWIKHDLKPYKIGKNAEHDHNHGYKCINLCGKKYYSHRLAWLYMYGEFPKQHIDHINGIKSDNKIINLRDVSNSDNQQNQKTHHKNSKSGLMGSVKHNNKFRAQITINGICYRSKVLETKEEAHELYLLMKRELHGDNCFI
jgi:hypothetical protein